MNLDAEDRVLLSLDFANVSKTVKRRAIAEIWSRIFPGSNSLRPGHLHPPQKNVFSRAGQKGDPLGSSLFTSTLQLILVNAHRARRSSTTPIASWGYLNDVSVTSTPLGVCSTLATSHLSLHKTTQELTFRKCALRPGLLPHVTGSPPNLQRLQRSEDISLLPIPLRPGPECNKSSTFSRTDRKPFSKNLSNWRNIIRRGP